MSLNNFVWSCVFIYLPDCILAKHLHMHQKTGLKTDKTVQNFTLANTYILAELLVKCTHDANVICSSSRY